MEIKKKIFFNDNGQCYQLAYFVAKNPQQNLVYLKSFWDEDISSGILKIWHTSRIHVYSILELIMKLSNIIFMANANPI